jgi:hypothetical protein
MLSLFIINNEIFHRFWDSGGSRGRIKTPDPEQHKNYAATPTLICT